MDQQHLVWLFEKLQSSDDVERWSAAMGLAEMQAPEAAVPLMQRLTDYNYTVRLNAASALGRLGDHRAIESLIACLRNEQESDHIRAAAARSLGVLGGMQTVK